MLINQLYKYFEIDNSKNMKYQIRFRNCKNNFKIEVKEFSEYEQAVKWGRGNIENFHIDMVSIKGGV